MTTRRTSPFLGFMALLLAVLALIFNLGLLPSGMQDLILRAWPALLILFGLWLLLRDRVPAAGPLALMISLGAAAALAAAAYSQRAAEVRTDNRIPIVESFAGVERLQIVVEVLNTQLDLFDGSADALSGEFVGARASALTTARTDDATTVFRIVESQGNGMPLLDDVGRGTLRLNIPTAIPVDLIVSGQDGAATLNLSSVALERLEISLGRGDIAVTLPDHRPISLPDGIANGTIATSSGNISLILPPQTAARLELNRGGSGIEPSYDPTVFNYLVGDVLESRDILLAPFVLRYELTTPDGLIRVTTSTN